MFDRTSLVRYSGTITELVRLRWMLKSLLMIVTATCCIAFYDNVYLQHLATMSTFQIKHLPMLFSSRFHTMTCEIVPDEFWTFSTYVIEVLDTKTKQSFTQ